MQRKFKITISKTVQEKQFEPYNVKLESEFMTPERATPAEQDEIVEKEYLKIEKKIDEWIAKRLDDL